MQGPPHSRAGNILRAWLTRRRQPRALLSGGFFVHSSSLVARTFMDGLAWLAAGGNYSNPPPLHAAEFSTILLQIVNNSRRAECSTSTNPQIRTGVTHLSRDDAADVDASSAAIATGD